MPIDNAKVATSEYENEGQRQEMTREDLLREVASHLDAIHTHLVTGYLWHVKMGNDCRKVHVRGLGRWHQAEAMCDTKSDMCLLKLLQDNIGYCPELLIEWVEKSQAFSIENMEDFRQHFEMWCDREAKLIWHLDCAIDLMRGINIAIYKDLMCLQEEVQNEHMRVKWTYDNFAFDKWDAHHILRSSKDIHEYFEHEYKGGIIDFNIG